MPTSAAPRSPSSKVRTNARKAKVTIKDLALGAELAKSVESRAEWVGDRQAQMTVKRGDLVDGSPRHAAEQLK